MGTIQYMEGERKKHTKPFHVYYNEAIAALKKQQAQQAIVRKKLGGAIDYSCIVCGKDSHQVMVKEAEVFYCSNCGQKLYVANKLKE